jgi:hypothetical protein
MHKRDYVIACTSTKVSWFIKCAHNPIPQTFLNHHFEFIPYIIFPAQSARDRKKKLLTSLSWGYVKKYFLWQFFYRKRYFTWEISYSSLDSSIEIETLFQFVFFARSHKILCRFSNQIYDFDYGIVSPKKEKIKREKCAERRRMKTKV